MTGRSDDQPAIASAGVPTADDSAAICRIRTPEDLNSWTPPSRRLAGLPPGPAQALGESFCRPGEGGISLEEVSRIARQAARVAARGVQLSIVVGGGNILRGAQLSRGSDVIKEATAHYMGMTATVINGLALAGRTGEGGLRDPAVDDDPHGRGRRAVHPPPGLSHLDKGRVVILATGTGSPFVTTDTAAALRGKELGVEVLLKATRVDGVYSADPEKNPHAVLYEHLTYDQVLRDELEGHGYDGDRDVHGERLADPGVQLQERGKHRAGHRGRADRHVGEQHRRPRPAP